MPPINISHWEQEVRKPPEYVTYMMKRILDLEAENEVLRNGTGKEE